MSQPPLLARIGAAITTTRRFVTNALFVIISIIILMAILSSLASPTVPRGAALVIDPAGYIVEERSLTDPLSALLLPGGVAAEATLRDIVRAIRSAVDDDGISMLVFDFNELLALSAVQAVEIGRAVDAFRATGREAIVYGYTYSQSVYLAASYADAVYMHPAGQLLLPGYGTSQPYLGEMFDKLKVKMHVFRAGEFKDAVEPFTASEMSDASREANQQLVDALWHHFSQKISENRVLEPERLRHYTHKLDDVLGATGGDLARAALEYGLVDELLTADQMNARVRETTGSAPYAPYLGIDYRSYLATLPGTARPADNVGLVVVDGPILMNDVNGTASADTITALIRQGREDPSIDAIVLRVDSPGGGSFASELIRQELELTQLAGKPVVASFAGVAASGGYWIASTSDRIVT